LKGDWVMAVSTFKLPKDNRLIRYQPGRKRIPGSITVKDFGQIAEILEEILAGMDKELTALGAQDDEKPKELHIRLNESDKPFPLALFVGWVESKDVQETRENWNHPHPALHRSGDDIYSEIYGEAINYANNQDPKEHFRYRDWAASELLEKRAGEKATDPKAGNTFQTCLAMVIEGRATGTLVVGFRRRPRDQLLERAQQILRQWARDDCPPPRRSALIDFLQKFELGGPHLKDSDWFRLLP
jgi:hypothetical protein